MLEMWQHPLLVREGIKKNGSPAKIRTWVQGFKAPDERSKDLNDNAIFGLYTTGLVMISIEMHLISSIQSFKISRNLI